MSSSMLQLGAHAKTAASQAGVLDANQKKFCLYAIADFVEADEAKILSANLADIRRANEKNISDSFLDRLILNKDRITSMADGVRKIADLAEPIGKVLSTTVRPNGLRIEKVTTPIGVIGVIYESRPNVTVDAAALCLKAGNAVILRGGSAAQATNSAIHKAIISGLEKTGASPNIVQWVETVDRKVVGEMLAGLGGCIDVIIPRGGKSLVARVQDEAKVPVFAHLEGICHTYVHKDADPQMALEVVTNAKLRRTGICGATETLLVDKQYSTEYLANLLSRLKELGCEVIADKNVLSIYPDAKLAEESDWSTEYLAPVISVGIVSDVDEAVRHISQFGSNHTEAIITGNQEIADYFLRNVDSAIVMHNASTQFADGGEFGMGAEIGIATGKMHARGPVGVEQLTTFKYIVRGSGQTRPS